MSEEKAKKIRVKRILHIAVGVLAAGLVVFAGKAFYQRNGAETAEEEKSLSVNVAEGEKASSVEIKESISGDASKKDAAQEDARASNAAENTQEASVTEGSQESSNAAENTQEASVTEGFQESSNAAENTQEAPVTEGSQKASKAAKDSQEASSTESSKKASKAAKSSKKASKSAKNSKKATKSAKNSRKTSKKTSKAAEDSQEALEQEATLAPPGSEAGNSGVNGSSMEAALEEQIQNMIASQYTAGGTVAVSAGRISDGTLALVNDQQMQAASLIKLFVAGCLYETLEDPGQYESQISSMISASDNTACNSLVALLGGGDEQAGMAAVNEYCADHGFSNTHMGRLMLQSNDLDDNYTSVGDCGNFLLAIYDGSLAGSGQILQYMKQQERTEKIPAGVPGVETANKTGELDYVENDAAIIFDPSGPYILCVMSENLSDAYSSRQFITSLSEAVYGWMG